MPKYSLKSKPSYQPVYFSTIDYHGQHKPAKKKRPCSYHCTAVRDAMRERKREMLERVRNDYTLLVNNYKWNEREEIYMEIYG